jgi:(2Fe-2S) ferredoxin
VAARDRDDPLAGTAPQARRWLLLEHPGPWPIDAVAGSGIEPAVLRSLQQTAAHLAARILLVRRSGRPDRNASRHWRLTGPGLGTVSGPWHEDDDLRAAVAALTAEPAPNVADPIILVCAHGVHDACCAIRGRPVAAALEQHFPGQVWECSHVGGCRFAPNVVLLPDGFYYGNLDPDSAVAAVRSHLDGIVDPRPLRGVANVPPPMQAAVVEAYARLGPLAPGAVVVGGVYQVGPHDGHGSETIVDLTVADRQRLRVEVVATRRPTAQLTCRAPRETPATAYEVVSFDLVSRM